MERETYCVRFDPTDNYIAAACGDGTIRVFNILTKKEAFVFNNLQEPSPTTSVRWRPHNAPGVTKNVLISVNSNGKVQHWHTTSGSLIHTISDNDNQLYCADFRNDGTKFATAGLDSKVRCYDETTKKLIMVMEGTPNNPGHSNRVFAAKFSKEDENTLLTGGWDSVVVRWDLRIGEPSMIYHGPYICGDGIDLQDNWLLTGSWRPEKQIQLWQMDTGQGIDPIKWDANVKQPHAPCKIYSCQFHKSKGDLVLAGGSGTNEAKLFMSMSGHEKDWKVVCTICELSRACYTVDFANQSEMFAIGGGDGFIRIFTIEKKA